MTTSNSPWDLLVADLGVHLPPARVDFPAVMGRKPRSAGLGLDLTAVPRVTFTDPEVAAVGVPTWDLADGQRTVTRNHTDVDRALAEGRTDGFSRLTLSARGRVLGATIVGPRAGESLAEATLAVRRGLSATDLAGATHPYPTYGDGVWNAALADVRTRLEAPLVRRATAALVALCRATARQTARHGEATR